MQATRTEGGLLIQTTTEESMRFVDGKTSEITSLKKRASGRLGRLIMIGDHIISDRGRLYTEDGREHRVDVQTDVKWKWLQRVGPGFITHYDETSKTLWYVERK